jgi:hypothetical protein
MVVICVTAYGTIDCFTAQCLRERESVIAHLFAEQTIMKRTCLLCAYLEKLKPLYFKCNSPISINFLRLTTDKTFMTKNLPTFQRQLPNIRVTLSRHVTRRIASRWQVPSRWVESEIGGHWHHSVNIGT